MLRLPIDQARPGMVLAQPVYNPRKPQDALLRAGYELDEEFIKRLKELFVPFIWVKFPNLDFLDSILDPELVHQKQSVYGTLKEQFNEAQEINVGKIDYKVYIQAMAKLFMRLLEHSGRNAFFVGELQSKASDIFRHGVSVAFLSLILGIRLEGYLMKERARSRIAGNDLTPLGVGALLHDIGKMDFPEEMRSFRLTAQDMGSPEWQAHTEVGLDLVHNGLDPTAAQVVLNHHQHFDGSGFPCRKSSIGCGPLDRALTENQIHIFCRIVTLADRFDNFRFLPNGQQVPTVMALKRLKNPGYIKWFDPVVYQAFLEAVPPFPPGEQITLDGDELCVVKEVPRETPYRPVVCPIDLNDAIINGASKQIPEDALEKNSDEETEDIKLALQPERKIVKVGDYTLPQPM